MSAELHVRKVVLKARHRDYEWRFRPGVSVIVGSGSVGKTSLLNLIKWGVGGNAILSPAIRTYGRQVGLQLEIEGRTFGLRRGIASERNIVRVLDGNGEVMTTLGTDPGDERRASVSDHLLGALGIPSLQVPRSRAEARDDLTRISFNDVFAYLYLDQDEIARSTIHHFEPARDVKRHQTFELLYRLLDTRIAELRRRIGAARTERERVDEALAAIRPFLERSGQPSRDALDRRATQLRGELAVVERELELLRRQARGVVDQRAGTDLRSRIEAFTLQRDRLRDELATARRRGSGYRRVRAQLVQDLSRSVRALIATPLFADYEFEVCPRCLQSLETEHADPHCRLCGQVEPENHGFEPLAAEHERLEAQLRETDELLEGSEREQRDLEVAVEEAEARVTALREQQDEQARESVAPFVDRMNALSARRGELTAEVAGLESSRRYLDEVARLSDRREVLRLELEQLEEELSEAEAEHTLGRQRVSDLSEIFAEILDELQLPWLREAHIDADTYLPIVNGERLEGLSSASTKALINSAYFLAGLTYAVRGYDTLLPRFLMIDSPRAHHGSGRVDRAAGERLYRWFERLQNALNSDAPLLGGRSFQLIVADNDLPRDVRGLHVKRLSREAPLLDDVPGLDDEELLRGLEEG